jgi:hypothetical protein
MIRKGDTVRIKPQWQDEGDFRFRWVALSDENHGYLDIGPVDTGLPYPPIYSVTTDMLEGETCLTLDQFSLPIKPLRRP